MSQPTVIQAAREVLARCDGAIARDDVGFNGMDSQFVRSLMEQVDSGRSLTLKQESSLYKLLRKYIKQLDHYGVDYNQIKPPVDKREARRTEDTGPMELRFIDHRLSLKSPISFKEQAKAIPTARWNPENKTWNYLVRPEVYLALEPYITSGRVKPSVAAIEALDLARTASQQRYKAETVKNNTAKSIPLPIKTKPYDHQDKAFQIGQALDQSALLMEQGTGKTLSAIAIAGHRYNHGQIKKLLIVCPLSVVPVWHDEFRKHADFDYSIKDLTRVKDKNIALTISPKDRLWIALVNYESSWRILDLLTKWNPDMIIIDESQRIKNGRAKQSKGLHKLGDIAKYKMILTGTPVTQGPLDMWSQYRFLNPDIFGRKFTSFRNRYAIMEGLRGRPEIRLVVGYKNLEELAERAHSIAYRVTKEEALDLPPTTDQTVMVQLSPEAKKIYKQMEKDFMVTFSDEKVSTAPIILTQLLRLQQITGGFLHTEDKTVEKFDSAKLEAVKEILTDLPHRKKVVIFARFTAEVEAISEVCRKLAFGTLVLDGSTKNRGKIIEMFQDDPKARVIIIQIQTGGLGITLTAADTAIFYSTTFSFADYEQAKARLHRIGQHHPVTYIHLAAEDTVDEDILEILRGKGDMATQIIDTMRKKLSSRRPFTNQKRSIKIDSMESNNKKEVRNKQKEAPNVVRKEQDNMIGLDQKEKGGWYWDETTGNISRREPGGYIYTLQKNVKTLEKAQAIVNNLNKKIEGEEPTMVKKTKKQIKAEKKAKKAAQTIEETAEEVEEEVEEEEVEEEEVEEEEVEEEEEPKTKKTKKQIKADKRAAKKAAEDAEEEEEEAPKPKKSKKSKPATKEETPVKKSKKAKKAAPAPAPKTEIDPDAVGVKELSEMVNMEPKALRKTLREMYPEHEAKTQWVWKRDSKPLAALVKKLNK